MEIERAANGGQQCNHHVWQGGHRINKGAGGEIKGTSCKRP